MKGSDPKRFFKDLCPETAEEATYCGNQTTRTSFQREENNVRCQI